MRLVDLQRQIADVLRRAEEIRSSGCVVLCEDELAVENDLAKQLTVRKGVAIVVATPSAQLVGGGFDGLPVDVAVDVVSMEIPSLNRAGKNSVTALAVAQMCASILNSDAMQFVSLQQEKDDSNGVLATRAEYKTAFVID